MNRSKKTKGAFILFLIKWFLIITIALAFFPITIVVLLFWLIFKKVHNKKLKVALAVVLAIPTLLFGSAMVYAFMHPGNIQKQTEKISEPKVYSPDSTSSNSVSSEIGIENVTPSPSPTPTPTPSPTPTIKPSPTIKPATPKPATPRPTTAPVIITHTPQPVTNSGGSYACNCSKTCTEISSCAEAQYLLNTCGCGARDGDKDGIACDGAPLHCQN